MSLVKEYIRELEELLTLSCYSNEADEYGVYDCCGNADYEGHKPDCKRVAALKCAIELLRAK